MDSFSLLHNSKHLFLKLCGLMDVQKLTAGASVHAAEHERLPLQVIVHVLFFDYVRSSISFRTPGNNSACDPLCSPMNRDEGYETTTGDSCQATLKNHISHLRIKDEELHKNGKLSKKNSKNNKTDIQLLPLRSRRIFDKLWSV
ncbi:hypothetical protein JHK87_010044 [Glycine soja]|nr:hypothetical protein JHK87_010044 [Glycine soja]